MLRRIFLPPILLVPLLLSAPAQVLAGRVPYGPPSSTAVPPPPPPSSSAVSYLQASPYEGHVGDIIRVSGAGLRPYTQYNLFMTCPAYTDPTVYQWGNLVYVAHGPMTDAHGEFVQFKMAALTLHHLTDSTCFIYAEMAGQGGGNTNIPGLYHIYPHGVRLPRCATQICGQVSISPSVPRPGHIETIHITTNHFAGAFTDITIRFSNGQVKRISKVLGPNGERYVRVQIPVGVPRITNEQVSVQFHLGRFIGTIKPTDYAIAR